MDQLEVTVKPLEASYFAGETFTCHITFRNLLPESQSPFSRQPSLKNHLNGLSTGKQGHRSALSLSSSAHSLPPPSPASPLYSKQALRTPQSSTFEPYVASPTTASPLPVRQGLIGKNLESASRAPLSSRNSLDLSSDARKSLYDRPRGPALNHKKNNYSVALDHDAFSPDLYDASSQQAALTYLQQQQQQHKPRNTTDAGRSSVNGRSASAKSSIPPAIDEDSVLSSDFHPLHSKSYSTSPAHVKSPLYSHSDGINSNASLPEDIADEESRPTPRTSVDFYNRGRNESMDSVLRDTMTDFTSQNRRPGPPLRRTMSMASNTSSASLQPSSTTVPRFPSLTIPHSSEAAWDPGLPGQGTQTLLWTFAQLQGNFEVDETLIKPAEFLAVKQALFGESTKAQATSGRKTGLVGGGSLEPTEAGPESRSGWMNWLWSGEELAEDAPDAGANQPTTGVLSANPNANLAKGSWEERRERAMNERNIPILTMPPSVFAVDLVLGPGESKTFSYTLTLPGDLPPTFRGRAIKFNYTLLVGTNRAPAKALGETQQRSRLLRVPIRINNNVAESGARPFYDLTNPIIWLREEAKTAVVDDTKVEATPASQSVTDRNDFDSYAANLLNAVFTSPVIGGSPFPSSPYQSMMSPSSAPKFDANGPEKRHERQARDRMSVSLPSIGVGDSEVLAGSKAAIETVSKTAPKSSFDINKDGYLVASLTLTKSIFRLGETINGTISLNCSDARVLKVSARLETHEQIETSISVRKAKQVRLATRRLHSEMHETTLDSTRMTFALSIPSGATPDFSTSGVKLQWSIRLSFLVLPPPPPPDENAQPQSRRSSHARTPSDFSRAASISGHSRSKSYAFGSEPSPIADPVPVQTGPSHLMPISSESSELQTSYRGVPDLAFRPVLFQSAEEANLASGSPRIHQRGSSNPPLNANNPGATQSAPKEVHGSVVLMPAKSEVIECSIPIKCYPAPTSYRPAIGIFYA